MSEAAQLHALVRGYVQGVGYRFFVVDRGEALGLTGYVRNLRDGGTVEVVAEGPLDRLETLLRYLQKGPRGSAVEGVEAHWAPAGGQYDGFEVRH